MCGFLKAAFTGLRLRRYNAGRDDHTFPGAIAT
jgi:hypothetical protein